MKIDADLQKELAEMALRDTRPEDRSTIIRNLSGLRHFSPQLSDEPVLDEKLSATRLPGLRRKR
ncbi:hypothetical protein ACFY3U_02155 [Micromonospora sp. NPDC000089]|uniref:hypothetical protein n=1 Tax=unclassified Micromonospora TaxID=2617518 RepID=UPI0036916DA1